MPRLPLLVIFAAVVLLALVGRIAASPNGQAGASVAGGPATCGDDLYEQNDARDDAPPLLQPVEIANLASCPDDTDWFKFHLFAGDHITIDVMYDDSSGDLDVSLHGPKGGLLATAMPVAPGDQQVEFAAPASGIYYVRIDPPPGATEGIDYILALSGNATPTPTPLPPTPTGFPSTTSTPTHTPPSGATPTHTPTPAKTLGDVNDDGQVNSIDAALILQYSAGLFSSLVNAPSADVNNSGDANAIDATLVLQYVAGLISHLPL